MSNTNFLNLRTVVGMPCDPQLTVTQWCAANLAAVEGQKTDAILIPASLWYQIKRTWAALAVDAGATSPTAPYVVNTPTTPGLKYTHQFTYDAPTNLPTGTTLGTYLGSFASSFDKDGVYFPAASADAINPDNSFSVSAQGVPLENATVSIPIGSTFGHKDLGQHVQKTTWVMLKLSNDGTSMHVYGGIKGLGVQADQVVTQRLSGRNDTGGITSLTLESGNQSKAVETLSLGSLATTSAASMNELWDAIKSAFCMPVQTTTNPFGG